MTITRFIGGSRAGAARPLRPNPLDAQLKALGAVFGEKNGWERVNYFSADKQWRRAGADQRAWGWSQPRGSTRWAQSIARCGSASAFSK